MTAPAPTAGRERLRAAISRILDVFVAREATPEEFEAWSGIAERYAERIEAQPPETVFWGLGTRGVISVTGMPTLLEAQPRLSEAGDRVEATVTYGAEHEGHPGLVHGGTIAATFDELFGMFQTFSHPPVVTAEMTVRFLRPVRVGSIVRFEAEIAAREGRKMRIRGQATVDGSTCAAAEALFIVTREP